jgi:predicted O-methyltransferase YrrM
MRTNPRSTAVALERVLDLYECHAEDLRAARTAQREMLRAQRELRPKLDDIEAEISYLLIRDIRPAEVVELGTFRGWSTTWLLRALTDNGSGRLRSYDIVDHARTTVPADLTPRWTFHHGDVREAADLTTSPIDYLFIDAAHTARFARWYVDVLFSRLRSGVVVSVHDVYHRARPLPFSEGSVVLTWLREREQTHFSASERAFGAAYREIRRTRRRLGLDDVVHSAGPNPMIYFTAP